LVSFPGFPQAPVRFGRRARHAGRSEYTLKKLFVLAKDGVFGFSDVPLKLATRLGFLVSVLSLVGILYAITVKLFFTLEVPGWTFTVVAIFFMGGVQLVMLGILGEYLGRVHDEVRHRPVYIIRDKINTD